MHEYGVTESIINILTRKFNKKENNKINQINIVIGRHSGFSIESIEFYFDFLKKDTIVYNAKLNFIIKEIVLECPMCKLQFISDEIFAVCIGCGYDKKFDITSGTEFFIQSVEMDDEDE